MVDVSKTAQWEVVFEHADHIGLYLHFKTQETENDQLLDGGNLGLERKLYYRELIARFGHHLALNWNLGEENTNTDSQIRDFADFFQANDPYKSHVVIHTYPNQQNKVYNPLLGFESMTGVSIQTPPNKVFSDTKNWVEKSALANHKWVAANDEQGSANNGVVPDANDFQHNTIRKDVLWGNIMAGGAGVEYYFGYSFPNSDLTCEDFRSRENMWTQSRYALDFFETYVPFWNMTNHDELVTSSSAWCLATEAFDVVVVYLQNGGTTNINLPAGSTFAVQWFDPRNGGSLQDGSVTSVPGGSSISLGSAPNSSGSDWAILITDNTTPTTAGPTSSPTLSSTAASTVSPIGYPTAGPTSPTDKTGLTASPTTSPTKGPTVSPTPGPTASPTFRPTSSPIPASPISSSTDGPSSVPPTMALVTPSASPTKQSPTTAFPVTSAPSISPIVTPSTPYIEKFVLVDASSNQDIQDITEDSTLFLNQLPKYLNVRAVVVLAASVGSVRFNINGKNVRTENVAPYALAGDSPPGNYFADDLNLKPGTKSLTATPYSTAGASGTAFTPLSVTFTVINDIFSE